MKKLVVALAATAALLGGVSSVVAQNDPIAQRKAILKGMGDATKPVAGMMKGEAKFDLAAVQGALKSYSEGSAKLVSLFPENSKTGGDTAALPKVWEDKARFDGIFKKLEADATAAAGAIKDEATFKAEFPKVLGNCKACHDDFRQKKS